MHRSESIHTELNRGFWVFVALVVLTVLEYALLFVPVGNLFMVLLITINLIDAGLIVWYFMHVKQLKRGTE